jgi:hypothetical protein
MCDAMINLPSFIAALHAESEPGGRRFLGATHISNRRGAIIRHPNELAKDEKEKGQRHGVWPGEIAFMGAGRMKERRSAGQVKMQRFAKMEEQVNRLRSQLSELGSRERFVSRDSFLSTHGD